MLLGWIDTLIGRLRRGFASPLLALVVATLVLAVIAGAAAPTRAASGGVLRYIPWADGPSCIHVVGIAFDGHDVLLSCWETNTVARVSPDDGSYRGEMKIHGIAPGDGIGAMSWDARHNLLWIGTAPSYPTGGVSAELKVYSVALDKNAGKGNASHRFTAKNLRASYQFTHGELGVPLIDGLAYDGFDNTLWFSPDLSNVIYHYTLDGRLIESFDTSGQLGTDCSQYPNGYCPNSGIAVGDRNMLYLGNNGGSDVYSATKRLDSFEAFADLNDLGLPPWIVDGQEKPRRTEDLECDNTTFPGKSALWVKTAFTYQLIALEVPAGQCSQGGTPPQPPAEGRMTGGGSVQVNGTRVTHGFELHCNPIDLPNSLEVNWDSGNRFHLENLTYAMCADDRSIRPNPPAAGFDTYEGSGIGRYNGAPGATADWTFTDAGEPGAKDMIARLVIRDASGNIVLDVASKNLNKGNHQAHK